MKPRLRLILTLSLATLLSGCVAFSMVEPGPATVGDLQLDASVAWNQAPASMSPAGTVRHQSLDP